MRQKNLKRFLDEKEISTVERTQISGFLCLFLPLPALNTKVANVVETWMMSAWCKSTEKIYNLQVAWIMERIMGDEKLRKVIHKDTTIVQLLEMFHNKATPKVKLAAIGEQIVFEIHKKNLHQSSEEMRAREELDKTAEMLLANAFNMKNKTVTLQTAMNISRNIHEVRNAYSKTCFIGFVGPQNAGKSTLLNALFGFNAVTGSRDHTEAPTLYAVEENVFAIDFPGTDSLEKHADMFKKYGIMNNLFIYVIPYSGSANKNLIENVRAAYQIENLSGKGSKTLFCLNKCGAEEHQKDDFHDAYKQTYIEKIRNGLENTDEELELEEQDSKVKDLRKKLGKETYEKLETSKKYNQKYALEALNQKDFLFTDWIRKDTKRGIFGPEEVKRRIREFQALNLNDRYKRNLNKSKITKNNVYREKTVFLKDYNIKKETVAKDDTDAGSSEKNDNFKTWKSRKWCKRGESCRFGPENCRYRHPVKGNQNISQILKRTTLFFYKKPMKGRLNFLKKTHILSSKVS